MARICAISPVGTIALYILLALCARLVAGHWPSYGEYLAVFASPFFKMIGAQFILWGAASLLLAPLAWIVLTWRMRPGVRIIARQILTFLGSWVVFVLLANADVFGFTSFLID